ncbi:restriction endonuclease [Dendrosporobacter sp. 1207_IL3150]|uniref:restriction endonuclease n=1 Tax=Dendrosporobacter sp. 1207_IL3150 TaxID=3084054 RepID=UPI002FDAEAE1
MQDEKFYYEQIISKLVQAIEDEKSVKTIKVVRNSTIQGRVGYHEVDIYWEFTDGEINYNTVIQVKDWNKKIGNTELFKLLSILRDIPGQTAGVLVTQPVYQKVTHDLARDVGITLYELKMPLDQKVWESVIENVQVKVDAEWAKAEKERLGMGDQQIKLGGEPKTLFIYDAERNCIDSVQGIFNKYIKESRSRNDYSMQTVVHEFTEPVFLQTGDELFPMVKLDKIGFDLMFFDSAEVSGGEMLSYMLDNVLNYFRS